MSQNFYTQTPNFISASSEDVDPRTRLFGFNHALGTLVGNSDMGPALDLTLSYSATTTDNTWGMGIGVMFTMTWYDKNSSTLYLDSGESYRIRESNDGSQPPTFEVLQCKIKTFVADKIDNGSDPVWYRITDSSGNITELREVAAHFYRPAALWSPLGYKLTLEWASDGGNPYLSSVVDSNGKTLFTATFDTNNQGPTMTLLPGSDSEQTISLITTGGYLTSMENSELYDQNKALIPWLFDYTKDSYTSYQPLQKITTPTGLVKSVIYDSKPMLFPDEAHQPPLPAVKTLTISSGLGSPNIVTNWSYIIESNQTPNYLGYGGKPGVEWSEDSDNLYSLLDTDYIYESVCTQDAPETGGEALKTIYSYNSYHLLESTVTTQGNNTHTVTTAWNAIPGQDFDHQPANFQCPVLQTETWVSSLVSRSQRTHYQYDDAGNMLEMITLADENGAATDISTTTTYEYYSPDGESDSDDLILGCPKDPYGLVHRLKSTTVTPPSVNGYDDVPTRTTLYRYTSIDTLPGMAYPIAVLPAQDTHTGSDVPTASQILMTRENVYDTTTGSFKYGRQKQQTAKVYNLEYNPDDPTSAESFSQIMDTDWSLDGPNGELTQENKLTTHDNLKLRFSETRQSLTGKPVLVTNVYGNSTKLTYDPLGRLKQVTHRLDTDYETSVKHDFTLETDKDGNVTAIKTQLTDSANNQSLIMHDGMGRPIGKMLNANDEEAPDSWYQTDTLTWDSWGRSSKHTTQDYDLTVDDGKTYSTNSQAQYDDWGQQNLTILSTGQQQSYINDPVKMTQLSELVATDSLLKLGKQLTTFDQNLMTKTEQMLHPDNSIYATTVTEYDGLNRLRKTTDTQGYVTSQTYDPFDRTATYTLPSGAVQSWRYAEFSPADLATNVFLKLSPPLPDSSEDDTAVEVGSRIFDGLGRIYSTTCGGRTHTATYLGANMSPYTTTDAMNQTLKYTYVRELDNAPYQVYGTTLAQEFDYYKKPATGSSEVNNTGRLNTAKANGSRSNSFAWFPSGKTDTETFTAVSTATSDLGHTWSLQGRPITLTDIAGNLVTLTYDGSGNLDTLEDPQVTVQVHFDDAGRLDHQHVEQINGSDTLTTHLLLDEFSRERVRTITPSSGDKLIINTEYYPNGQIQNRETKQGDVQLRYEEFTYDNRNRLTVYTCSGTTPTQDAYGQPLSELHFTLDDYSNITDCKTVLADGKGTDDAEYQYTNLDDPCQLKTVTHTLVNIYPASISLEYDDNGRMYVDEAGRTLEYDEAGRLIHITGADGESHYAYDAFDQLVTQSLSDGTRELYYSGDQLLNEVKVEQNQITRFIPGSWGTSAVSDEDLS